MAIYLDHAATTPVRPEVIDAMLPYLTTHWGNPSSIHASGRRARQGLDEAREEIARLIGARPREIVFTASGSEADNLAIKGAAWAASARGRQIITTGIEHKAVLQTCALLERHGFEITILPVDSTGLVDPEALADAITDRTVLVSVMAANNEVGTLEPVRELSNVCRSRRVLFHVDAIQAAPFEAIDVDEWQVDLLSLSAHKLYGPKGIGALYVRRGTSLVPQLQGGSQERQRRAGTENVAGAVGFAAALSLVAREPDRTRESARLVALRDELLRGLAGVDGARITGHLERRLPNSASVVVAGIEGGDLVAALDLEGIEASTGSACTTGSVEPSHVLLALGIDEAAAHGSLRMTLGRSTTAENVSTTIAAVRRCVARLREASQAVDAPVQQISG